MYLNVYITCPSRSANNLSFSYSWPNASARLIEQEVTSTLEGLFFSIKSLKNFNNVIYHINLKYHQPVAKKWLQPAPVLACSRPSSSETDPDDQPHHDAGINAVFVVFGYGC